MEPIKSTVITDPEIWKEIQEEVLHPKVRKGCRKIDYKALLDAVRKEKECVGKD